jgi:hypothetical protein
MPQLNSRWYLVSLDGYGRLVQWAILLSVSAVLVAVLSAAGLPAAVLLGAMAAAILVASADSSVSVPRWCFVGAQGVIGCMIAGTVTPSIIEMLSQNWFLFLACVGAVIAASGWLGWLLARWGVVPGATAVWGSAPGAAAAATVMAEAYGADVRLVAFMQYLRVVMVVVVATVVARLWTATSDGAIASPDTSWFPPILWGPLVGTMALVGLGAVLARFLRLPAGPLLVPLMIGGALHGAGMMVIELPPWLLATSYALIGWSVGLRFSRPILLHALCALPRLAVSVLALIALCGGLAFLLTSLAGIDPLTAYLATSPGGADSVAIIASSSHTVDVPFVMAMQTARLLAVVLVGSSLARFVSRRIDAPILFSHKAKPEAVKRDGGG